MWQAKKFKFESQSIGQSCRNVRLWHNFAKDFAPGQNPPSLPIASRRQGSAIAWMDRGLDRSLSAARISKMFALVSPNLAANQPKHSMSHGDVKFGRGVVLIRIDENSATLTPFGSLIRVTPAKSRSAKS